MACPGLGLGLLDLRSSSLWHVFRPLRDVWVECFAARRQALCVLSRRRCHALAAARSGAVCRVLCGCWRAGHWMHPGTCGLHPGGKDGAVGHWNTGLHACCNTDVAAIGQLHYYCIIIAFFARVSSAASNNLWFVVCRLPACAAAPRMCPARAMAARSCVCLCVCVHTSAARHPSQCTPDSPTGRFTVHLWLPRFVRVCACTCRACV